MKLCIQNIIENSKIDGNIEILIVNDNPKADLTAIKHSFTSQCDLAIYTMDNNSGYSAACNVGAKLAKYDYIVFMDSDIMPQKQWLNELINTYKSQPNPGSVSSKIIEADTGKLFGYGIGVHGVDIVLYKRHGELDEFSEIDRDFCMVSSGCLFMKKSLYLDMGGQDENFFNADNDLDLTYRITLSGKTNTISSKSIVYHRGHVSGNIRVLPSRQDSKAWLFKKWGEKLSRNTMEILSNIIKTTDMTGVNNNVILVSFSNSLSRNDYFDMISKTIGITYLQKYDFKNTDMLNSIFINDFLTWDVCRTNLSIIYFTDDYRLLENNTFWFSNRVCNDLIIDRNGNSLLVKKIM